MQKQKKKREYVVTKWHLIGGLFSLIGTVLIALFWSGAPEVIIVVFVNVILLTDAYRKYCEQGGEPEREK